MSTQEKYKYLQEVDLGLPSGTKWANCNVGATKPEESGGYYAWGETKEKDNYNEVTCEHIVGEASDNDGFYQKGQEYQDLGESICGTKYDVAHMKCRDKWQMPSKDQFDELLEFCSHEWTTLNGVYGCLFTGTNGNSIFLPAVGMCKCLEIEGLGCYGYYWTGTHDSWEGTYFLEIKSDEIDCSGWDSFRHFGMSVRPVITPEGKKNQSNEQQIPYDLRKINLFRTEEQKNLYAKYTEGIEEPDLVYYDWDYDSIDSCHRRYDFYDEKGFIRKCSVVASDGFPRSVTLFNEFGDKTHEIWGYYMTGGFVKVVSIYFDGTEDEIELSRTVCYIDCI